MSDVFKAAVFWVEISFKNHWSKIVRKLFGRNGASSNRHLPVSSPDSIMGSSTIVSLCVAKKITHCNNHYQQNVKKLQGPEAGSLKI
jgi:hypothetical protein